MAEAAVAHPIALPARSGFGTSREQVVGALVSTSALTIREQPFLHVASIRLLPKASGDAIAAALAPLGLAAPGRACTFSQGTAALCGWIEPRAWIVVAAEAPQTGAAAGALVTDISDRYAVLDIEGAQARDIIASGCDPTIFSIGTMTRVRFGSLANLIVARLGPGHYRLMIDVSLAGALAALLTQAAANLA